jgi:hypothetical protein
MAPGTGTGLMAPGTGIGLMAPRHRDQHGGIPLVRNKGAYPPFAPAVTEIDCISRANPFHGVRH